MSAIIATCPSCGGQVSFRIGTSFVSICEYCGSAVARSDRGLEDRGKVIDLIDSQSPLDLNVTGRYGDSRFEIVGRTQSKHAMGGVWDEWYCAFDSGHWGWLAEAQGRYYMSFRSPLETLPVYADLTPGQAVPGIGDGHLVVSEKGQAQVLGAKGEIPYPFSPGGSYTYADLSGPDGAFGTLDFQDAETELYLGKEVSLDELGISVTAPAREAPTQKVAAHALQCPNCKGSLELVAPNQAERVACPYCGALSDVNQGKLSILQILDKSRFPDPPLALGSKGTLNGHEMVVAGFMVRSTSWHDETFFWDEYLLYNPRVGFRWLTSSDGHWSFVEPVASGDLSQGLGESILYDGQTFQLFDRVSCQVEFVLGQFYWKVGIGERVYLSDYISPPHSLSEERSESEVNWSQSTYIAKEEIEEQFGVELDDAAAGTVGINQKYPQTSVYKAFGILFLVAIAAYLYTKVHNRETVVFTESFSFPATSQSENQIVFSAPFTLEGGKNIEVKGYSPLRNSWMYLEFDLINEASGAATFFDLPIEYYSGSDWSEGSQTATTYLKETGAGAYTLRIATERQDWKVPMGVQITVREGVTRGLYWFVLLGFLAVIPFFTYLHHRTFEKKRWSDASEPGPWWARTTNE